MLVGMKKISSMALTVVTTICIGTCMGTSSIVNLTFVIICNKGRAVTRCVKDGCRVHEAMQTPPY